MLKIAQSLVAVMGVGLVIGASPNSVPDDRALIIQARREQNAAIARADFAATAAVWTQDVSVRAGLGRDLQGQQQYRDAFIADSAMLYVREPIEVVVSTKWPLAYERGHWTGLRRGGSREPLLSGQYSAQWVKSGSRWLIPSEVFVALDCTPPACGWPAAAP